MSWNKDDLLTKAKLYFSRAASEDRESEYFALLYSFGLEFLVRSCVASKNPVLLAAPDQNSQENLLAAIGEIPFSPKVKSLETSKVIELCKRLYSEFTPEDATLCRTIVNGRNEELHTGSLAFESYPFSSWMNGFYECLNHISSILQIELDEILGSEEAGIAKEALKEKKEGVESAVKNTIAAHKKVFSALSEKEKGERKAKADKSAKIMAYKKRHIVTCPSCEGRALLEGEPFGKEVVTEEDGELISRISVAPTAFECTACGLKLTGISELNVCGLAGHFTRRTTYTPEDYYGLIHPDDIDAEEIAREYLENQDYGGYNNE